MEITKVRELGDAELRDEARKSAEQLFRIHFQLKLGQNDGVKKLQVLKRDIARLKTIERERTLGVRGAAPIAGAPKTEKAAKAEKKVKAAKPAKAAKAPKASKKEVS